MPVPLTFLSQSKEMCYSCIYFVSKHEIQYKSKKTKNERSNSWLQQQIVLHSATDIIRVIPAAEETLETEVRALLNESGYASVRNKATTMKINFMQQRTSPCQS